MEARHDKTLLGPCIRLHPADNVLVARKDVGIGAQVPGQPWTTRGQVPAGHKIAARAIRAGEPIVKYNVCIGFAATDIAPGSYVHSHNVSFQEYERDYAYGRDYVPVERVPASRQAMFDGIVRADGRVGTRNYVGILSTVNCSATVVRKIAEWFTPERLADYPNVDGVVAFSHSLGCGMEMTGEPMDLLRRTMAGYARHANLGGALIVGLGCERNQLKGLLETQSLQDGPAAHLRDAGQRRHAQDHRGGHRGGAGAAARGQPRRAPAGAGQPPDGRPAVRRLGRLLVDHRQSGAGRRGGPAGAPRRHRDPVGDAGDLRRRTHADAARGQPRGRREAGRADPLVEGRVFGRTRCADQRAGQPRQPDGRAGQHLRKSLGSSMKGGTGPLMAVYRYAEPVTEHGLVFMDTPGYDPVSATGQIAGGANLIAFTTGRGSMFGAKPVPSVKLATNSPMYRRLEEDMDLNCGTILDGEKTIEQVGEEIFQLMLRTASGQRSKSELLGLGDNEFVPWHIGIMS
ncbi:UxaA family hydrolase [Cupriavidus sp. H18C1]